MTTYKEVELKNRIDTFGEVEITIVDKDGKVSEKTFTDFNEAKTEVLILENENAVYF